MRQARASAGLGLQRQPCPCSHLVLARRSVSRTVAAESEFSIPATHAQAPFPAAAPNPATTHNTCASCACIPPPPSVPGPSPCPRPGTNQPRKPKPKAGHPASRNRRRACWPSRFPNHPTRPPAAHGPPRALRCPTQASRPNLLPLLLPRLVFEGHRGGVNGRGRECLQAQRPLEVGHLGQPQQAQGGGQPPNVEVLAGTYTHTRGALHAAKGGAPVASCVVVVVA